MKPRIAIDELIAAASRLLGQSMVDWRETADGADHLVVIATTGAETKVVIKAGLEADVDAYVLRRLQNAAAPVPSFLAEGRLESSDEPYSIVVMSFVEGNLLADEPETSAHVYLPLIIDAMRLVHQLTTKDGSGPALDVVNGSNLSWKDYLRGVLSGRHPNFDWAAISESDHVDPALLDLGLQVAADRVDRLPNLAPYALLHGDLNPYNIFVSEGRITGIVDWSYARFGDPLFDFARLRLNPIVRSSPEALRLYFDCLGLDRAECDREETYYLVNLLEYVNWYVLDNRPGGVGALMTLLAQMGASGD